MDVYKAPKNIPKELFDQCIKTGIPLYFEKAKVALEVRKPYTVDPTIRFHEEQCVQKSKLINGTFLSDRNIAKKPIKVMNRYDEEYVLMPVPVPSRKTINVLAVERKRKDMPNKTEDTLYATQFINDLKKGAQACLELTDNNVVEEDVSTEMMVVTEQMDIEDSTMTNEVQASSMHTKDSKVKPTKFVSVYDIPSRMDDDFMWTCIRKNVPLYTAKLPTATFKVEKFNKKKHAQYVELLENPSEDKERLLPDLNVSTLQKSAFNSRSALNALLASIYSDRHPNDTRYSPGVILVKNRATYVYVFTVMYVDEFRIRRLDYLTGEESIIQEDTALTKLASLPSVDKLPVKNKTKATKVQTTDNIKPNLGASVSLDLVGGTGYAQLHTSNSGIQQEALLILSKLADITKDITNLVAKLSQ